MCLAGSRNLRPERHSVVGLFRIRRLDETVLLEGMANVG
jgi:hypothetical protein